MEKGFLLDCLCPGGEVQVAIREAYLRRKNSVFFETQMSPNIGRIFEVKNKCKVGMSFFRGTFCFLRPFSKRAWGNYVMNFDALCFLQRRL